jgi:lysophospholipase L1-like esterase
MRDRERDAGKAPGSFRILALGDSHLFGWGVAEDQTMAARLESALDRDAPGRFEVLNAGVPGYNAVMEARVFERRADELDPDLVLIHFVYNDKDLPNFLADPPDPFSLRRSALAELIRARFAVLAGRRAIPRGLFRAPFDRDTRAFAVPEERIPVRYRPLQGWDALEAAYARLAEQARARGIPYAVLFTWPDYAERLAGQRADVLPTDVRAFATRLAAMGYQVIDPQQRTLAHLRRHGLPTQALWIRPDDNHMSPLHHQLAADEIHVHLEGAGLLGIETAGQGVSAPR